MSDNNNFNFNQNNVDGATKNAITTTIKDCYCPNCRSNHVANTTMYTTTIPYFHDIVILSLQCSKCNYRSNDTMYTGTIQSHGCRIRLHVRLQQETPQRLLYQDLNRRIVKSDTASIRIPEWDDFVIPAMTQRGCVSTLEGILSRAVDDLQRDQPERVRIGDLDNFYRCQSVIDRIRSVFEYVNRPAQQDEFDGTTKMSQEAYCPDNETSADENHLFPFDVILDDPAGNSYIENPTGDGTPQSDPQLFMERYTRTDAQNRQLGISPPVPTAVLNDTCSDRTTRTQHQQCNVHSPPHPTKKGQIMQHSVMVVSSNDQAPRECTNTDDVASSNQMIDLDDENHLGRKEVLKIPTTCPSCYYNESETAETSICIIKIPHFKEVIIMSTLCERCGYKTTEIKSSGVTTSQYATRITLTVNDMDDLKREVLKSETAGIDIPEIQLHLDDCGGGSGSGIYTTVEGLLRRIYDDLKQSNPFACGDAAITSTSTKFLNVLDQLRRMAEGEVFPFGLVLNDPLSNSCIGPTPRHLLDLTSQSDGRKDYELLNTFVDPGLKIDEYVRTFEQNEMLGLNDIKTENYRDDEDIQQNQAILHASTMEKDSDTNHGMSKQKGQNLTIDDTDTPSGDGLGGYQMHRFEMVRTRGPDHASNRPIC